MTIFAAGTNLAFSTYQELTAGISDWMNRSDLSGSAPQMIALTEARLRRALAPHFQEVTTTLTTVGGVVALPSDCDVLFRVIYSHDTLPRRSAFNQSDLDYNETATTPYAYTIEAGNIRLWPACDVTITVVYKQTFPALSESSPTNVILSVHPDVYFFGAMMFAEGYVSNDPRAANFKALFDEALGEVIRYIEQQRYTGPLVPRIRRQF